MERGSGSAVFDMAVHPLICHSRDKKWAFAEVRTRSGPTGSSFHEARVSAKSGRPRHSSAQVRIRARSAAVRNRADRRICTSPQRCVAYMTTVVQYAMRDYLRNRDQGTPGTNNPRAGSERRFPPGTLLRSPRCNSLPKWRRSYEATSAPMTLSPMSGNSLDLEEAPHGPPALRRLNLETSPYVSPPRLSHTRPDANGIPSRQLPVQQGRLPNG